MAQAYAIFTTQTTPPLGTNQYTPKDSDNITTLPTGRGTSRAYTVRRPTGMSWPITAAACSTPAVRPRSYDAGWAKLRDDDAGLGPVTPGCPGRLRRQHALRQAVRPRWRPACTTRRLHGSGLRLNRPPGGADANEPWTVSRTNTYRGAVLPKGANTGGGALEGCSHGSTGTGHNQRANSFGPNELPAIATSGDTMLAFWMGLPAAIVFRPPWRSADFLEGPGAAAQVNDPTASQSWPEL